jgi:hypothetical protein
MSFRVKGTNVRFKEMPGYCGGCPAGIFGNPSYGSSKGQCYLFGKVKNYYDNPPKRCRNIIEKGLELSDGQNDMQLVIVYS